MGDISVAADKITFRNNLIFQFFIYLYLDHARMVATKLASHASETQPSPMTGLGERRMFSLETICTATHHVFAHKKF